MKRRKGAIIIFLLLLIGCGGHDTITIIKPTLDEFTYEQEFTFQVDNNAIPNQTQPVLSVSVLRETSYKAPDASNQCNNPITKSIVWKLTDPDDYVDIIIQDNNGVPPGFQNSRGYTLLLKDGTAISRATNPLIMAQADGADELLFQERWRIKLNAHEDINNELGNGRFAPDVTLPPYERNAIDATKPFGQKWILQPNYTAVLSGITATLIYHLKRGNVPRCP